MLPSVVQINTDRGLGSGVVFDTRGNIVTNAHVVGQATKFQVRLADSPKSVPATLVGAYPPDDLAVIKLDEPPSSLQAAHFGDSTKLQVGEIVMAMGNPLGLTGSVTNGIVSATSGRTVTEPAGEGPGATLPDVIQTSAAINPGNSGGALVDLAGNVIGIPTLAALEPQAGGGGGSTAPGIGFAIPSNLVTEYRGAAHRPWWQPAHCHGDPWPVGRWLSFGEPALTPVGVPIRVSSRMSRPAQRGTARAPRRSHHQWVTARCRWAVRAAGGSRS